MYVLPDVSLQYEDMYTQIDYIVITKAGTYFVECKNLFGNINVIFDGEFQKECYYNTIKSIYRTISILKDGK